MIEQYPHRCTFRVDAAAVWSEGVGWVPGSAGNEKTVVCKAVSSTPGKPIRKVDGVVTEYAYDLAFPLDGPVIPAGTLVKITGIDGELFIESTVLRFQKGQLHLRAWV